MTFAGLRLEVEEGLARLTFRLLMSAEDQPLEAQLELEAQALARIAATSDARNALVAFAEKRKPVFNGR